MKKDHVLLPERRFVDLHTHSSASDGTDSPADLVRKADKLGLAAIALTDHDTVGGLNEATEALTHRDMELVRGCEVSTITPFGEAHFLGLWLPSDAQALGVLEAALYKVRQLRATRNQRMSEKLKALGMPITLEAVEELAEGEVVGRPHFAQWLCREGKVSSRKEAFELYLGFGKAAYVPRDLMQPEEAVHLLASIGATVAFAHPRLLRCSLDALDEMVRPLVPLGLSALEAYHSEHSAADVRDCVSLALRHDLLLTGGSDYHGLAKAGVELGFGKGGLRVTTHVLDTLKAARLARGLPV